jgi:chromosome segregation ATPase
MEKTLLFFLIILGILFLCLGLGEMIRSRKQPREFWILGLGVRSKAGAWCMVLIAGAFFGLAYSFHKMEALHHLLRSAGITKNVDLSEYIQVLEQNRKELERLKVQSDTLAREKEDCQGIVRRQGLGLASKNDVAAELKASLSQRQKEISGLTKTSGEARQKLELLQNDYEKLRLDDEQTIAKLQELDSKVSLIQTEKMALQQKLDGSLKTSDTELKRLKEENMKSRALYKDQERRSDLLRQGLLLHERNDWTLEQEVQRLSTLISSQLDVNSPHQTDIARSIQRIQQVLRDGQVVTKQTKATDGKAPEAAKDKADPSPGKKP